MIIPSNCKGNSRWYENKIRCRKFIIYIINISTRTFFGINIGLDLLGEHVSQSIYYYIMSFVNLKPNSFQEYKGT